MASPPTTTTSATGDQGTPSNQSDLAAMVAWIVFAVTMVLLNRTKLGGVLIYYGLVLLLLFVVLTQFQWFQSALAPLGNYAAGAISTARGGEKNISGQLTNEGHTTHG